MFGKDNSPALRYTNLASGLRTELGTVLPVGNRIVAYVHSSGMAALPDQTGQPNSPQIYTTLNAALRLCAANKGDTVLVLPGHTENIGSANQLTNLVAGTRIIGGGVGRLRPTFTWTAATSTVLLNVADVRLENLRLMLDPGTGTTTVAAPITISAAGVQIDNCEIRMGTDVNSTVAVGITTTAAANDLEITGCNIYGATASVITTGIRIVGGARLKLLNTRVSVGTSAVAVGGVQFLTTAATDVLISDCAFVNTLAASTAALTGMAGLTGMVQNSSFGVQAATGADTGFKTRGSVNMGGTLTQSTAAGVPTVLS